MLRGLSSANGGAIKGGVFMYMEVFVVIASILIGALGLALVLGVFPC